MDSDASNYVLSYSLSAYAAERTVSNYLHSVKESAVRTGSAHSCEQFLKMLKSAYALNGCGLGQIEIFQLLSDGHTSAKT